MLQEILQAALRAFAISSSLEVIQKMVTMAGKAVGHLKRMRLKDEHWGLLAPLLTPPEKKTKRGRPRRDDRALLEGIL